MSQLEQSNWRFSLAGVDGCKQGWVVAAIGAGEFRLLLSSSFTELMSFAAPGATVAVDMPIGLPRSGRRACDIQARQILGPKKQASVFYAPPACVLTAATHQEAADAAEQQTGKRISIQAWNLVPKIKEVAEWIALDSSAEQGSASAALVNETHPELCFLRMNGGNAVIEPKKTASGQEARRRLLMSDAYEYEVSTQVKQQLKSAARMRQGQVIAAVDDTLDAYAALSAARRHAAGVAEVLPKEKMLSATEVGNIFY